MTVSDRTSPSRSTFSATRRQALGGLVGGALVTGCATTQGTSPDTITVLSGPSFGLDRFTVNLETWWRHLTFPERIDRAVAAGFTTAEMWGLAGGADKDPQLLHQISRDTGLEIVHCTVDAPSLVTVSSIDARDRVEASLEQINKLGARYGTVVAHQNVDGMTKPDMLLAYQDHLQDLEPLFRAAGVIACIEPFNPFNHPGHFLYGASDAVAICRKIDSPFIKINWDLFHMQRHEGNLVHNLREGFDQCGLLQIADSPDRREPGTGEINYAFVLSNALQLGFEGPIGLECFPGDGREDAAVERIKALANQLTIEA